jgi:hypothetical protein
MPRSTLGIEPKLIVDLVLIHPSPFREGPELSRENLQKLAEMFRSLVSNAQKQRFTVTDATDPDTLQLHLGMRDIKPGSYCLDACGS